MASGERGSCGAQDGICADSEGRDDDQGGGMADLDSNEKGHSAGGVDTPLDGALVRELAAEILLAEWEDL